MTLRPSDRPGAPRSATPRRRARAADRVEGEVVRAALLSVVDEIGSVLKRSSYSPIIREMQDYSCGLFDAGGVLVLQGAFIPAQLGAMSLVVQEIVARYGPTIQPGDVFIANDPYSGGAHTPDVNVVRPVFVDAAGRLALFGFTGTVAHQVDFGGRNPGTEGADNRQLFEEGLVLPPIRLERAGAPLEDVRRLIEANVRDPISTIGDLRAQSAACRAGERRLLEVVAARGAEAVAAAYERELRDTDATLRAALAALPDGEAEAEGFLDDDGAGGPPVRLHVRLVKHGTGLTVDLSGSAAQVGGGLNNPWASTRACVAFLLVTLAGPDATPNDALFAPVEIVCPAGSILNPRRPAAVSVRHLTCQRLGDVLLLAASRLWPELAVGSSWVGFFSLMAEGISPRTARPIVIQDVVGGGSGAHGPRAGRQAGPGLDGVDTLMSNVALLSAEVCETEYPWRLARSELVDGTEGRGLHDGGRGLRRTYEVLGDQPQAVVLYCEQTDPRFPPRGALGGGDGSSTRLEIRDPEGRPVETATKATLMLEPGSTVTIVTGGGGAWGPIEGRRG